MTRMRLTPTGPQPLGYRAPRTCAPKTMTPERMARATTAHRTWAAQVIARDKACQRCGTNLDLTADHITPLAHGGAPYDLANGQALCRSCNGRKGARERRMQRGAVL